MCRAEIPVDYLDHPILLEKLSQQGTSEEETSDDYQWYYEGRNGILFYILGGVVFNISLIHFIL